MPDAPGNDIAIRTQGLTKDFGKFRALDDLTLDVRRGEVFGFLGPNGAGKTTAIRTLMDEIRATAGRAWMLGRDVHRDSVEIRRELGYLPSDLTLYPNLTGSDTIKYFANLRGGVEQSYVDELTERLGADLSKKVGDLSSGNRQKVGIIQAFMNRPSLIIMDEPSSGLDPLVQREFQTMMRELVNAGGSVFLSSHTLSEVQRVADRVGIIRGGLLIALESVTTLRAKGMRSVELDFAHPVDESALRAVAGVRDLAVDDTRVRVTFEGQLHDLITAAGRANELLDVHTQEADLEEVFLTYYRDEQASA